MSAPPPIESVSGGSHGVEAGYEQMLTLAHAYDDKAAGFVAMGALGATVMADGDLLESALLSPLTFAHAEGQVLGATAGSDGVVVRAVGIEADALAVRAVVAAFRVSDVFAHALSEQVDHLLGRVMPLGLPLLAVVGGAGWLYYEQLPPAEQERFRQRMTGLVHEHPDLVQHLINGGGGLTESLLGPGAHLVDPTYGLDGPATTNDAARLLALYFGNDIDFVNEFLDPDDVSGGATGQTPQDLADLVEQLDRVNEIEDRNGATLDGSIQVQRLGDGDDARYVVYLPGTDDMSPIPGADGIVRDMLTNYQAIAGMDTAYGRGIHQALTDAGLQGEELMFVGHSQGGMVATALAADSRFTDDFVVRHVVTAGSPTAQVPDLPESTWGLHLENRGDVVPLLDGEDNPDQPHRTTVQFDDGDHDVVGNHDIAKYARGAAAVDASDHGSIRTQLDRMRADGFLGGGESDDVRTIVIRRP